MYVCVKELDRKLARHENERDAGNVVGVRYENPYLEIGNEDRKKGIY